VRKRLSLITHLRTSRCTAAPLGDQPAHPRRGAADGSELRQAAGAASILHHPVTSDAARFIGDPIDDNVISIKIKVVTIAQF
jgi:hypothetical protein